MVYEGLTGGNPPGRRHPYTWFSGVIFATPKVISVASLA
jgi:hypothetical protein